MTTETTSLTLHERLREAAAYVTANDPNRPTAHSYCEVRDADLAAIEHAIRAEATAPLRQEVEEMRDTLRATEAPVEEFAETLMHEFGGPTQSESAYDMAIRLLRSLRTENAEQQRKLNALDGIEQTRVNEIARLRAENAALRQAGNALRIAVERLLSAHGDVAISGETSRLFSAAVRYDAATTPRAEETPMPSQNVIDWLKSDVERLTLRVKLADRMATEYGNASENNPNTEAIVSAWSDYYELMVKELMPDTSPTDAAGEGEPAPWETYWIDTSKRLAALEQRADKARDQIDRISKVADENTHNLWDAVLELQRKVEALEARGPQPVAVTEAMVRAFWEGYSPPFAATNNPIPHDVACETRAGLTAALAAAAKGAGK